jgi:signal peptidase II
MEIGQEFEVFSWFRIHFIENNGMAFGMELFGKLFLSIFRIIAISYLFYFIHSMVKNKVKPVIHIAFSLILAGAIGNMVDSTLYGMIFNESYGQVSTFLPEEGGYAPILYGKVVDMLYFPIWKGFLPEWIPFYGGDYFIFFRPVFNLADTAISIGVILLILFNKSLSYSFQTIKPNKQSKEEELSNEIT